MDISEFFSQNARISRRALARYADVDPEDLDQMADALGFGTRLRLDEAEEVLAELDGANVDDSIEADNEDPAERGD